MKDINQVAASIADKATNEGNRVIESFGSEVYMPETPGKNPNAVALGRLGGMKGGKARAARLTQEQRSEIARKAAQARWQRREGRGTQ